MLAGVAAQAGSDPLRFSSLRADERSLRLPPSSPSPFSLLELVLPLSFFTLFPLLPLLPLLPLNSLFPVPSFLPSSPFHNLQSSSPELQASTRNSRLSTLKFPCPQVPCSHHLYTAHPSHLPIFPSSHLPSLSVLYFLFSIILHLTRLTRLVRLASLSYSWDIRSRLRFVSRRSPFPFRLSHFVFYRGAACALVRALFSLPGSWPWLKERRLVSVSELFEWRMVCAHSLSGV